MRITFTAAIALLTATAAQAQVPFYFHGPVYTPQPQYYAPPPLVYAPPPPMPPVFVPQPQYVPPNPAIRRDCLVWGRC